MARYSKHYAKKGPTPQSEVIPGREADQAKNNAGGVAFTLDDFTRLDRFLVLGSEGNTYYCTERKMTIDNAQAVARCIKADGERVVARIVEISDSGRAPKNDPALFALALCAAADDVKVRRAALAALPKVARIGTHLFHFAEYVNAQRGWGRALRAAIGNWYNNQSLERLADQVSKYRQRDGWSNRDLLRLAHPETKDATRKAVYDWVCGRENAEIPASLKAIDALAAKPSAEQAVVDIHAHGLVREHLPTELLNDPDVWAALLEKMPLMAMTRNLGKMSAVGLLKPLSPEASKVAVRYDADAIKRARLHPISLLIALRQYAEGHGEKGSLTWTAVPQIVDALNDGFYKAFKTIEPTGKRIMLALDVSGSMGMGRVAGSNLTPREASAAMALVTAATEENYYIVGFTSGQRLTSRSYSAAFGGYSAANGISPLNITPKMRLDTAVQEVSGLAFGGTDCALPMQHAMEHGLKVDAFVIYTDNETWAGGIHPSQALQRYRQATSIEAKLIVVGMTATEFSIADPKDAGMLDVVGFDTNAPALIADFIRG